MKKKALFLVLALWMSWIGCYADEGMWIPMLLKKYNIEDMQKEGFKLTAEDIYDINKASLKDAVIGLGREGQPFFHFCTGEIISNEGLVVTNHHCSFDMIQNHSGLVSAPVLPDGKRLLWLQHWERNPSPLRWKISLALLLA